MSSSKINCICSGAAVPPHLALSKICAWFYDGSFGYLSVGLENPGGGHNGMNGAPVVMGIYDPDENAHGGEHWLNYKGSGVYELKIHDTLSAFRHWKDSGPSTPGLID